MKENDFKLAMINEGWSWDLDKETMENCPEFAELVECEWVSCFSNIVKKKPLVLSTENEKYFLLGGGHYDLVRHDHFADYMEILIGRLSDPEYFHLVTTNHRSLSTTAQNLIPLPELVAMYNPVNAAIEAYNIKVLQNRLSDLSKEDIQPPSFFQGEGKFTVKPEEDIDSVGKQMNAALLHNRVTITKLDLGS